MKYENMQEDCQSEEPKTTYRIVVLDPRAVGTCECGRPIDERVIQFAYEETDGCGGTRASCLQCFHAALIAGKGYIDVAEVCEAVAEQERRRQNPLSPVENEAEYDQNDAGSRRAS